jgi:toxin ParE1/3/4
LRAIARYTFETWGAAQAVRYLQGLQDAFQVLAANPELGRNCDSVSPGLRRHEQGKHVVFYRLKPEEIRIVRVLHQQMIPVRPRFEP